MVSQCCSCNGLSAKCIRCACVKCKRPCVSFLPIRIGKCRNTICSRQESSSLPLSVSWLTTSTVCQRSLPADHQVIDSVSAELHQVTTVGTEPSLDNADAQVPSGRSSVNGHEQDGVECLNTDTESRDLCTNDSQRTVSHGQHNGPTAVVGRRAKGQADESLSSLREVYDEIVHWWKRFFKLLTE